MARMTLEEKLAAVGALERAGGTPGAWNAWLEDAQSVVVARAATAIGRLGLSDCRPALAAAFFRFVEYPQPATVDKLCRAKEALILALDTLGYTDPAPYLRGLRHVQMEPVFGGREDTAPALRAHCATALARLHAEEAHFALAPLLFDPEPQPRDAAVKALTYLVGERSELLLRMKVLAGDADPGIIGGCFVALLALEPDRSLPFVADYLHPDRRYVEQAALALGNSRHDEAFPLLRACWEANSDLGLRKTLLLALALTRGEPAFDYLLTVMREEGGTTALLALDALALYGADRRHRDRLATAVAACRHPRLADAFTTHFPPEP